MSTSYKQLLKFERPELQEGLVGMLSNLTDKRLRQQLAVNPVGTLAKFFPGLDQTNDLQRISEGNLLFFSILSNDAFRSWAQQYQQDLRGKMTSEGIKAFDKEQVRRDFARAILEKGDASIINALLTERDIHTVVPQAREDVVHVESVVAVAIVVLLVVAVTQIDVTPVAPHEHGLMLLNENSGAELREISAQLIASAKKMRSEGLV
jgi:hypothetical protein